MGSRGAVIGSQNHYLGIIYQYVEVGSGFCLITYGRLYSQLRFFSEVLFLYPLSLLFILGFLPPFIAQLRTIRTPNT
jgi:hypothetical protein